MVWERSQMSTFFLFVGKLLLIFRQRGGGARGEGLSALGPIARGRRARGRRLRERKAWRERRGLSEFVVAMKLEQLEIDCICIP
ncbi:hypothetical protein BD626DRAFT_504886 [Schizophyllum amplum]|uniref:Uncharacterized protein n=1 Tax=Schizophyllum amplum TaxID=97359 RepID=A0A550C670_9AGAR|nr:hypothetical protein BD626DRAFT_504886 [Auriculariopsis ampla]